MFLLFLLLSTANAHVPTFDSTSEAYKISDKSWGVYRELKKDESFSIFLDVPKDKNISFSVNLAGSQDEKFDKDLQYIEVTLLGHSASNIDCDPKFTGWGYNHTRRLDGGLDESKNIPQQYGKLHFEPFGVGYYRAIAACQGNVPVADSNFTVTVKALRVIDDDVLRISIGAGMAEQFDIIREVLFLPVLITRTWIWDQYLLGFIISQIAGLMILLSPLLFYLPPRYMKQRWDMYKYKFGKYLMIGVLLHNIVVYTIRFLAIGRWVGYTKDALDDDFDDANNIWIALGIHIIAPAVFLVLVAFFNLKSKENALKQAAFHVFHILFIAYCLFFLIQTFWLGAVASIILYVTRIRMPFPEYNKLPQNAVVRKEVSLRFV